jgi:hypothetical protein
MYTLQRLGAVRVTENDKKRDELKNLGYMLLPSAEEKKDPYAGISVKGLKKLPKARGD